MSELIDLVDRTGAIQQTGVRRDDAATYEGLHMQIVIVVVVNAAGKILVHKRSATKRVNPGDIDHVCGGMYSGETPEVAAVREASEEGGVAIRDLRVVQAGVNEYNRYRYLMVAHTEDEPNPALLSLDEVVWARFYDIDDLKAGQESGEFTFVDGFFEDVERALSNALL